jgi:HTH-type transcriptional regulator / antitoxin HigA
MQTDKTFRPDWISAPGDSINQILKQRNLSTSEFAQHLGESLDYVKDLIQGRTEITPELAQRLALIIGATPEFWIARERKYREDLKTHESDEEFLDAMPWKEMIKFGWIQPSINKEDLLENCFDFFQVPDAKTWFQSHRDVIETSAFRTSLKYASQTGSVSAWLRQGELLAETIECGPWNPEKFRETLNIIRALTREDKPEVFLPELTRLCAECGVAVVTLQSPFYCKASGATRFISPDKAMLLLSFRYFLDDHFWFTFFHEAGHILLHNKNSLFVDEDTSSHAKEEEEANEFAANILIPAQFKQEFLRLRGNKRDVIRFARQIGISRGIVVGQLQHLGILKRSELNGLKINFKRR